MNGDITDAGMKTVLIRYLNFKFDNYMELPPNDERKAHPVSKFMIKV